MVSDWDEGAALVVCNDPDIAAVEIQFPAYTGSGHLLAAAAQNQRVEDCFLLSWNLTEAVWLYPDDLRLRGYDAEGNLVYESPVPESWTEEYNISDPDGWRFRYDSFYSREDEP